MGVHRARHRHDRRHTVDRRWRQRHRHGFVKRDVHRRRGHEDRDAQRPPEPGPAGRTDVANFAAHDARTGRGVDRADIQQADAVQHRQGLLVRRAALDGRCQQATGTIDVAVVERLQALVHQRFGFSLPLRQRAARPVDVGPRPIVGAIEEQHARPDVHRVFEPPGEVLVEAGDEQLLDAGVAFGVAQRLVRGCGIARQVRHGRKSPRV